MTNFTEVTATTLKLIRGSRGLKQEEVAGILGLEKHNISKIESGKRLLSAPEKALLDLYFFGTIPFEIINEKLLEGVLDFTEDQWRVICILAKRLSLTPGKWIANQIRSYLAYDEESKGLQFDFAKNRLEALPSPPVQELSKVAEEHSGN